MIVSKKQQRFMGLVRALQKKKILPGSVSPEVRRAAVSIKPSCTYMKKKAESSYLHDFVAGLEPTGVITFRNAYKNKKHHKGSGGSSVVH